VAVIINIVVSPTKCKKCDACRAMASELAAKYPGQIEVNIILANTPEADRYGVVLPPTVVVADFIVAAGNIPRRDALEDIIRTELGVPIP
jgi:hypothetical protein